MPLQTNIDLFKIPPNATKIWRYTDLAKFLSLITEGCLFFSSLEMLSKEDPYEGNLFLLNDVDFEPPTITNDISQIQKENNLKALREASQTFNAGLGVNCWHKSEIESAAMWKLYSFNEYGIAIESNIGRLKDCLEKCDELDFRIGEVYYGLPPGDINYNSFFWGPMIKRRSFTHEQEIRIIALKQRFVDRPVNNSGFKAKIDLKRLISHIHIAPDAPSWILPLVTLIVDRFNYSFNVTQSRLNQFEASASSSRLG